MTITHQEHPKLDDPSTEHPAPSAPPARLLGRIDSNNPGPTLVVLAAVHGNERAGIHAAQRVLQTLDPEHMKGSFVAILGNIAALTHPDPETRFIDHDLNRLCTHERFSEPPSSSVEHAQMFELFDHLAREHQRDPDMVVLDLHTTSAPSTPIVAFEDALPTRELALALPLPRYLGLEEELQGLVFDAATRRLGVRSLLIEAGQHQDPESINIHEASIWTLLDTLGIAHPSDHKLTDPRETLRRAAHHNERACYDLRHREPITAPDFAMEHGVTSGTRVSAGRSVIAHQNTQPCIAAVSGIVFLPNMQRHKRPGDDAFFIVRKVSHAWFDLSARLRTQPWVHTLIRNLPGVHPTHDHELLVRADLAAVFKRQLFHLFGYRLVRHDGRTPAVGSARITQGIRAFTRALFDRAAHPPRRDDPEYWIVRRRRLDVELDPTHDDA